MSIGAAPWEAELRRLGDAILSEPVPERLRAICSAAGRSQESVEDRSGNPKTDEDKD